MKTTVALCTWNRSALLDQTLRGLRELRVPAGSDWELIVVDNKSTDDTAVVIERHASALPIRRIYEPRQGLSHARNAAIEAAEGDLILWTDDDVLVDPDWLAAYRGAADRWPDAAFFGGEILPWYEAPPPTWVLDNLERLQALLLIRDLGDDERAFTPSDSPFGLPYGANMAYRRAVLRNYRFDPTLGSLGHRKIFGEETALLATLAEAGFPGVWVPSAKVKHYVTRERASLRYLTYFFYWVGRSVAAHEELDPDLATLRGAPRYLYRRHAARLFQACLARARGRPEWITHLIESAKDRGRIHGHRERVAGRSQRRVGRVASSQ